MAEMQPAEITVKIKLDFDDLINELRMAADRLEMKSNIEVHDADMNEVTKAIDVGNAQRWAWG